jgi:hypothetical protein
VEVPWTWYAPQNTTGTQSRPVTFMQSQSGVSVGTSLSPITTTTRTYPLRVFVAAGLISYGPDIVDEHRRAANYVDRILRGEKPADLPVQSPTKYEYVINLKTPKLLASPFRRRCWPPPTRLFSECPGKLVRSSHRSK